MKFLATLWQKALGKSSQHVPSGCVAKLERALPAARDENQSLLPKISGIEAELDGIRTRNQEQLNVLAQRLGHIESESEAAHRQLQSFQHSLKEALKKLEITEALVGHLGAKLDNERRKHRVEVVILALAGTIAVAWVVERHLAPEPNAPVEKTVVKGSTSELIRARGADPDLDPRVAEVLQRLQDELDAQKRAQRALRAELGVLGSEAPLGANNDAALQPAKDAPDKVTADSTAFGHSLGRGQSKREERLEAAGVLPYQAESILATADRLAMERLNVQFQAEREGWADERYAEALRELPSLRDVLANEYGDDAYDLYLYASGSPNRVVVRDVYSDSPASMAGLINGDRVISMDGQRVYSERDMREIATSGSAGETIAVVVERDGARFEVYVPRRPLGVRTMLTRVAPD
jgi:hypothetical protein